jgi:flagellar basal body rod protein FlgB
MLSEVIYYRLQTVLKNGRSGVSNIIALRKTGSIHLTARLFPNPVKDRLNISLTTAKAENADMYITDANGKVVVHQKEKLQAGTNTFSYATLASLASGLYYLRLQAGIHTEVIKFNVIK